MITLRDWAVRLWGTFRPSRTSRDVEDELRLHLELAADAERRRGTPTDRVQRAAVLKAGHVSQAIEAVRDQRGLPWLDDLTRDVQYGGRLLARNPGFATVSVLSLAVGIGVNCAVFSFADALLLRPLPVPRPADVLTVGSRTSLQGALVASYREYVDIRARTQSFAGLVAFTSNTVAFATTPDTVPTARLGMLVDSAFFSVLGVEPLLGRTFRPDEDQVPGRDAVVMLGHDFWTQQFGGDRAIVGRTVSLNGIAFTIIGVTPPEFTGLDQYTRYQFYAPLMMWPRLVTDAKTSPLEARDLRSVTVKGRLTPGVTLARTQTELSVIATDLERAYPDTNRNRRLVVRTELQARIDQNRPLVALLATLAMLAGTVLFVACGNVAGLLTSRAPVRAREMAMRVAIGAGRRRLIRQLITESVLISAIGCALGLVVGYAGVSLLRQFQIPTDLPIAASFELDRRALLFSVFVAFVTGIVFALGPAIQSTRTDLTAVMKSTDAAGFGRRRGWGRALLVSGQVAVSVVVLVTAASMQKNISRMLDDGPGYRTDRLLQMNFNPGLVGYTEPRAQQFFDELAARARRVPGVRSVSLASSAPTDASPSTGITMVPEGLQFPEGQESVTVLGESVDEHYFDTIALPIVRGRGFRTSDTLDAPLVAIVNEHTAGLYWSGQDPLGKRFRLRDASGPWVEIVGVAKTGKYIFMSESPRPFVYLPYRQRPQPRMALLVESIDDPASLAAPLREVIRTLDANQPVYNVRTLNESYRSRMVSILEVVNQLVTAMGIMGLGLAIVGLYGLVAYAANRRTREIGIRMAIGASRVSVLRMVVREGVTLAVVGLCVGLIAGVGARQAQAAALAGAAELGTSIDLVALAVVASVVLVVTLLAAYLPARRASRINPTDALRLD